MIGCALIVGLLAAAPPATPAAQAPAGGESATSAPTTSAPTTSAPPTSTPTSATTSSAPTADTAPSAATSPAATGHPTLFHGAPGGRRMGRLWGAGVAAAGVVLLGVAAGAGINTLNLASERSRVCPSQPCTEPSAFHLDEEARNSQNLGVVLAVTGGALAVAGATLFVLDVGGGKLHAAPAVTTHGAGVTFSGAF
jgi:hypothetical protein